MANGEERRLSEGDVWVTWDTRNVVNQIELVDDFHRVMVVTAATYSEIDVKDPKTLYYIVDENCWKTWVKKDG
jgi:hypothetical protein